MKRHFAVPLKLWALFCVILGTSLTSNILLTWILALTAFAYLLAQKNYKLFCSMGIYYSVIATLLWLIQFHGFKMILFSEFHVILFWNMTPVFIVAWDLMNTPPGELSAFLSSIHAPTSLILGVLVTFRFFPTMKNEIKSIWKSMKNRGLTSPIHLLCHPLVTLEYILVPILIRILQIADQLSVSAVARGAESNTKRGSYYEKKMGFAEYLWVVLWTASTTVLLTMGGVRV